MQGDRKHPAEQRGHREGLSEPSLGPASNVLRARAVPSWASPEAVVNGLILEAAVRAGLTSRHPVAGTALGNRAIDGQNPEGGLACLGGECAVSRAEGEMVNTMLQILQCGPPAA